MGHIVIISSSVRTGRKSHGVALYFQNKILEQKKETVEILDLEKYNFPIFNERLIHQNSPIASAVEFSEKIKKADGVIIVTPEYNGGYPASIKNAVDLLIDEWKHKPVAISTVSDGQFGGSQVLISLQFSLFKLHALTSSVLFPVPKSIEVISVNGEPIDPERTGKRFSKFIDELRWLMEAKKRMEPPV